MEYFAIEFTRVVKGLRLGWKNSNVRYDDKTWGHLHQGCSPSRLALSANRSAL